MKNPLFLLIMICFAGSCTKTAADLPSIKEEAIVTQVRYACGPSCDAAAWTVQVSGQTFYEPLDLPKDFQINDLPITLTFQKTGVRAAAGQGTGDEKIVILQIAKR